MTNAWHRIRQAGLDDLATVVELIDQRTDWLAARGSDQWSTRREQIGERMQARIEHGETWLLTDPDGYGLGTISLTSKPDTDFWTPEEQQAAALYLSRLATRVEPQAAGVGRMMLDWSLSEAARRGCTEVRLDAWKTASGLHDYYVRNGWTYLRTVEVPGRRSGALFSRKADPDMRVPNLIYEPSGSDCDPQRHDAV